MERPIDTTLAKRGIFTLDANYIAPKMAAIFIVIDGDEVAIIETATAKSLPIVEDFLASQNLSWTNVRYIIPTHVHLDHSAGAGALMRQCPNAELVIHPRGARHMADPTKLIAGARAVYGDAAFNDLYGEILPIDPARMVSAEDGFSCNLGRRTLNFIDTPGHAYHHFSVLDTHAECLFAGDALGLSYREFDVGDEVFIMPATSPTQFDPEAMTASIDNLMRLHARYACLTHFGAISQSEKIANKLKSDILRFAEFAKTYGDDPDGAAEVAKRIHAHVWKYVQNMGGAMSQTDCAKKLKLDIDLCAQGLMHWHAGTLSA